MIENMPKLPVSKKGPRSVSASRQLYCPDCGRPNPANARFCQNCGRSLLDVIEIDNQVNPVTVGDEKDASGRLLGRDGTPLGADLRYDDHDEHVLWEGRPSKLWSPRMALMTRYKLTSQRLMVTRGFIGRSTEELDLYRVNDVSVKQHPMERIAHIGDVSVISADSTSPSLKLENIGTPDRVKDMIRESARQERERRRVRLREEF